MKKTFSPLSLSIRWVGLFGMLCLWASCSSPRLAQNASPANGHAYMAKSDEAPQAAQGKSKVLDPVWDAEHVELVASNDPAMLPAVTKKLDASLSELAIENPTLARKVSKLVHKAEKQAAASSEKNLQPASVKDQNAAQKLIAKAEKKFDIMKAKKADAAQANTALVGLGALLAVVGLVLVLATSGTAATIGLVALIVGVVLLILSLLTN